MKGEEGRVKPSVGNTSVETNSVFTRRKQKKLAWRTLLPLLFPLHWQSHGIHAIALLLLPECAVSVVIVVVIIIVVIVIIVVVIRVAAA